MKRQMKCATAIGLMTTTAATGAAFAQDGAEDGIEPIENIIVTGIRNSLQASQDVKRNAVGVVDAITAEDIGRFPDTNLAESLQRITGVSIDRTNNEGNQVTVRGFGPEFNMVTVNGRQMPRSSSLTRDGIARSFNFRELSSELVTGVHVYKTGQAHVDSGGIGATINVTTARPFDYDGFTAVVNAAAITDTSVESGSDFTPEVSGLISNTFMDGKVGILLAVSHAERDSHTDRAGTEGWVRGRGTPDNPGAIDNGTGSWWAPWTADLDVLDNTRERQNGNLVLQFAPTDNLTATLEYSAQRFEQDSIMNRQGVWFDSPTGTVDANGTLVNLTEVTDELNFWAWEFHEKTEGDSYALNLDWQATDNLSFVFDFHNSTSESNPDGVNSEHRANLANGIYVDDGMGGLTGQADKLVNYTADFSGSFPVVVIDHSGLPGGNAYDPAAIIPDLYHTFGFEIEHEIEQTRLDGIWENSDDGGLRALRFGVQNTTYDVDVRRFNTFSFVLGLDISELGLTFQPVTDELDEFGDATTLYEFIPRYSAARFIELTQEQGLYGQAPPSLNGVEEETTALYLSAEFETEFNGLPISATAGVRYEDTDVTSYTVQEGVANLQYNHLEGIAQVFDGIPVPQGLSGSYTKFLPNLDLKFDVTDEFVSRVSYSRTIARAGLQNMFPATNIVPLKPGDPARASQGNPGLLPYTSDNLDFSVEYYYGDTSYASIGYFKKYVNDFIGQSTDIRTINDTNGNPLTDPSVNADPSCPNDVIPTPLCFNRPDQPIIQFETTTTTNQGEAEVDGWELNIQHFFGDTGFGAIANYTLVDTDSEYDVRRVSGNRALPGVSDSANLVALYEKDRIQARLTYNWRDDFLLSGGQEPRFVEDFGQIDASFSYDVSDNVTVILEGLNLTNETLRRHGRYTEQLIDAEQYGTRYSIGVRARF